MAVIGGDLLEITYNNPDVGSGVLYCKSGEDSTFDPGGFRNSDDANNIDGGGRMIVQKNRVQWSLEAVVTWDMNVAREDENLRAITQSVNETEWTMTHVNGTVFRGTGTIVGDIQPNGNTAQITLKIAGGGVLERI